MWLKERGLIFYLLAARRREDRIFVVGGCLPLYYFEYWTGERGRGVQGRCDSDWVTLAKALKVKPCLSSRCYDFNNGGGGRRSGTCQATSRYSKAANAP